MGRGGTKRRALVGGAGTCVQLQLQLHLAEFLLSDPQHRQNKGHHQLPGRAHAKSRPDWRERPPSVGNCPGPRLLGGSSPCELPEGARPAGVRTTNGRPAAGLAVLLLAPSECRAARTTLAQCSVDRWPASTVWALRCQACALFLPQPPLFITGWPDLAWPPGSEATQNSTASECSQAGGAAGWCWRQRHLLPPAHQKHCRLGRCLLLARLHGNLQHPLRPAALPRGVPAVLPWRVPAVPPPMQVPGTVLRAAALPVVAPGTKAALWRNSLLALGGLASRPGCCSSSGTPRGRQLQLGAARSSICCCCLDAGPIRQQLTHSERPFSAAPSCAAAPSWPFALSCRSSAACARFSVSAALS